jgi:excisionase family DNA binding protein
LAFELFTAGGPGPKRKFLVSVLPSPDPAATPPLLVTVRQAAAVLAISERTLWALTKRGEIPVVRLGRAVRYDPKDLVRLIEGKKQVGKAAGRSGDISAAP